MVHKADGALFQRSTRTEADKESGTCSSVSLFSGRAAAQTARPATSIATLRCETVSVAVTASTATDSRTPSAPLALAQMHAHL